MKEMNGPSDASPPGNKKQIGSSGSPSKILAGSLSIPKIRADFENHLNHNDAEESRRSVILLLDCISSVHEGYLEKYYMMNQL